MDTIIIGQGYNLMENSSVGKELLAQFDSHRYTSFTCLVAFASYGGVSSLTSRIIEAKNRGVNIKIILGIDQKGTSKEALEEVLTWDVDAKIYHTDDSNIFHPKIYLFENEDIFSLIVGSNNLTVPGLVQNIECSLLIKDINSNPVLGTFYQYWKNIVDGTEVNLYPITRDLIDKLYEDKVITLESERYEKYDNGEDKNEIQDGRQRNILFKKAGIQRLPEGFVPKRRKRKVIVRTTAEESGKEINTGTELRPIDEQVLIAEIGKGERWKQVNFPVKIFQEFFGAIRGDNTYSINLINIREDGSLGEVETRQAVTVKSNNFRFEINCKETAGNYPGGDEKPIGIFVKLDSSEFVYQVLMPGNDTYKKIRDYLYIEARPKRTNELKRVIVDVEAIHALYPDLII